MELIAALTVGVLMAVGVWLLLDRSLIRVVLGVVVLSNAVNMAVIVAGRLGASAAPFLAPGEAVRPGLANPLPQALVLTAIVIGFGLIVFALALLLRVWEVHRTVKTDEIARRAEAQAPGRNLEQGVEHSAHRGPDAATDTASTAPTQTPDQPPDKTPNQTPNSKLGTPEAGA